MLRWPYRTLEDSSLFNPGFSVAIMASALSGFAHRVKVISPMPMPLSYLVLPIVLNGEIRRRLPSRSDSSMPAWIVDNWESRILVQSRIHQYKELTENTLLWGGLNGFISFDGAGHLVPAFVPSRVNGFLRKIDGEARECILSARGFGKWLSVAGDCKTILSLWGVEP